jgi:hypothetical protein
MRTGNLVKQCGNVEHVRRPAELVGVGALAEPTPVDEHHLHSIRERALLGKRVEPPSEASVDEDRAGPGTKAVDVELGHGLRRYGMRR